MKIKQAVIPAAGLGVKFLPISKTVPKELLPILDKTCLEYVIEEAIDAGVEEFVIVISKEKQAIESYFQESEFMNKWLKKRQMNNMIKCLKSVETQAKFTFVYQDEPLGLGHAINCACPYITDDYFFILLPDDIIDSEVPICKQMLEIFSYENKPIVTVMEVPWEDVCRYGIVKATPLSERVGEVQTIEEKPDRKQAPSNLAVMGRYLLPKEIFSFIEQTNPGAGDEIQLTDALKSIIAKTGLRSYVFKGNRYDTGDPLGLLKASLAFSLKDKKYKDEIQKTIKILAAGI